MTRYTGSMIVNIDSTVLSKDESLLLENDLIAGVLLFTHNYTNRKQMQSLIESIKNIRNEIFIAVDQEGGRVQRFKNQFSSLPSFSDIGDLYSNDTDQGEEMAYSSGYVAGYELKDIGIDVNFSPVVDLSSDSLVLNSRTFSHNAETVIKLASSYIKGLIDNGIVPTLKHFPGHGAVTSDTHTDISECDASLAELKNHISVFRDIYERYKFPIMTSHITYNEISSNPVTTSIEWLQEITKIIFNNKPFFISDDLEMSAITKKYENESRISVLNRALRSGCDMVIVTTMQNQALIKNNMSYDFYNTEYIKKSNDIDRPSSNDINLLCSKDITYNTGNNTSYHNALECIKQRFNIK